MTPTQAIERLRKLEAAATHAPWTWRHCYGGNVELVSPPDGMLLVMDAVRDGMNGASIRFAERSDNMGGLMKKAASFLPTPGIRVPDYPKVGNPDMELMALARNVFPFLLAAVEAAVEMRGHFPQSTAAIRSGSIKRFDAALSALARKVEEMER